MESAGNGSDAEHRGQLPIFGNASFCRNFTEHNATFAEARCDVDRPPTGAVDNDANPVFIAIAITALYSIVCMVGLVGNVLVMYIIVRYTKMKTATNIYIFNLALADALATSTLPFQSVNYLMGTWPFGNILCKMVMSIDYYNMFTSIFTLTTMSIDRYVAVCHPVKALDFRTPRNAKIVNVCNWILSSTIGLPVMFMASTVAPSPNIVDCKLIFPHPSWYWDILLKICVFIFAFIMPILIITVCYGLMILRLRSVRMLSGSQEKDRNLRRITRMVLVVVAVFIICWTPIHIFVIITALIKIPSSTLQTITWHFCIALGYTNSSLNPVLYGYLDENFKRCFREFCTPSQSGLEMQNSSRTGATSRKLPQRENHSANTGDRSNQQRAEFEIYIRALGLHGLDGRRRRALLAHNLSAEGWRILGALGATECYEDAVERLDEYFEEHTWSMKLQLLTITGASELVSLRKLTAHSKSMDGLAEELTSRQDEAKSARLDLEADPGPQVEESPVTEDSDPAMKLSLAQDHSTDESDNAVCEDGGEEAQQESAPLLEAKQQEREAMQAEGSGEGQ
ncbi:mu-type opioid receptor [Pholidichthys leucotaenia]